MVAWVRTESNGAHVATGGDSGAQQYDVLVAGIGLQQLDICCAVGCRNIIDWPHSVHADNALMLWLA
jgi:hypothetical protein